MLLPALLAVLSGCADEIGPEVMPTARVTGRVREGTRPVQGGWVEFLPVDGTVGLMCSAPIGADGRFQSDRVPAGVVAVGVNGAKLSPESSRILFNTLVTPIRRKVPATGSSEIDIDLIVERAAWEVSRSARK
ncbi:MAG: hypothetical protein U0835_20920 [Isosphaeraceae bacterium]